MENTFSFYSVFSCCHNDDDDCFFFTIQILCVIEIENIHVKESVIQYSANEWQKWYVTKQSNDDVDAACRQKVVSCLLSICFFVLFVSNDEKIICDDQIFRLNWNK